MPLKRPHCAICAPQPFPPGRSYVSGAGQSLSRARLRACPLLPEQTLSRRLDAPKLIIGMRIRTSCRLLRVFHPLPI
jgi:hypothetical protein